MMSPIFRKRFSQAVCLRNATMLLFAIAPSLAYAKQQPYTIGELFGLLAVFALVLGPVAYFSWIGEKEEKEAAERHVRELEAERERKRNDPFRQDQLDDESAAPLLAEIGVGQVLPADENSYFEKIASFQNALRQKPQTEAIRHKLFLVDGIVENAKIWYAVEKHFPALSRNFNKRVKRNDYGKIGDDQRDLEAFEFLDSIGIELKHWSLAYASQFVKNYVEILEEKKKESGFDPESLPADGHEFEHWVANALNEFGWDAQVTQGSGDQGLDVLAKKDGVTVAVQCKLYSSNVGNKAVQEVIAAKGLFSTDYACVVSNAGYTASAKELAESQKVLLLSHYDLPRFDELFL